MVSKDSHEHGGSASQPTENRSAEDLSATVDLPSQDIQSTSFLWLTNRDQWLVVIVAVVLVALLAVKWQRLRYVDRSSIVLLRASEDIGYQIELNSANWVELTQLRDVGTVTARQIVSDREEFGPFSSIDDLQRVRGVGPKTVEKNRRWLRVDPTTLPVE